MTEPEQTHIADAFSFELGKCLELTVKQRMLGNLAEVDADLCSRVAAALGLAAPTGTPATDVGVSPALSQVYAEPGAITGRVVGILAVEGADLAGAAKLRAALEERGAVVHLVAEHGGSIARGSVKATVDRTYLTTRSIEFDAVVVAGGAASLATEIKALILLQEAYRHLKVVAAWGDGAEVLASAGVDVEAPGVVISAELHGFTGEVPRCEHRTPSCLGPGAVHRARRRTKASASASRPRAAAGVRAGSRRTRRRSVRPTSRELVRTGIVAVRATRTCPASDARVASATSSPVAREAQPPSETYVLPRMPRFAPCT